MFAYINNQLTTAPAEPLIEMECTWRGESPATTTYTITNTTTEPTTCPPSGTFNNPACYVPPHNKTNPKAPLPKKKRTTRN